MEERFHFTIQLSWHTAQESLILTIAASLTPRKTSPLALILPSPYTASTYITNTKTTTPQRTSLPAVGPPRHSLPLHPHYAPRNDHGGTQHSKAPTTSIQLKKHPLTTYNSSATSLSSHSAPSPHPSRTKPTIRRTMTYARATLPPTTTIQTKPWPTIASTTHQPSLTRHHSPQQLLQQPHRHRKPTQGI